MCAYRVTARRAALSLQRLAWLGISSFGRHLTMSLPPATDGSARLAARQSGSSRFTSNLKPFEPSRFVTPRLLKLLRAACSSTLHRSRERRIPI